MAAGEEGERSWSFRLALDGFWGGSPGVLMAGSFRGKGVGVVLGKEKGGETSSGGDQGFKIRPVTGNRRPPVPIYRSGLAGYRSELNKFKFKFKLPSSTGLTGIPAGLTSNWSNLIFFFFWFKFKCPKYTK
jgi:hypothetical protein